MHAGITNSFFVWSKEKRDDRETATVNGFSPVISTSVSNKSNLSITRNSSAPNVHNHWYHDNTTTCCWIPCILQVSVASLVRMYVVRLRADGRTNCSGIGRIFDLRWRNDDGGVKRDWQEKEKRLNCATCSWSGVFSEAGIGWTGLSQNTVLVDHTKQNAVLTKF